LVFILAADAFYIHLRTAVKRRKKRKIKPKKKKEEAKPTDGKTPSPGGDLEQGEGKKLLPTKGQPNA